MSDSAYDASARGGGAAIPTELFIPVRILILRAKDGRRFLSPPMQELEDIPLWASGEAIHPGLATGGGRAWPSPFCIFRQNAPFPGQ